MERALPVIDIKGTKFIVDVANDELKQLDNPDNTIWFPHMQDRITHYVLAYDLEKKTRLPYSTDTTIEVNIPTLISLDPQGMAETYNINIKDLAGKTDYEIIVDQKNLALRSNGKKPELDITGDIFIIDMERDTLQLKKKPEVSLALADFDHDGREDIITAFYHTRTKSLTEIDAGIHELPEHIVQIKIPEEIQLDPVYAALEFHQDFRSFLRNKPLILCRKAEVVPLEKTYIKDIVAINLQSQNTAKKILPKKGDELQKPGRDKSAIIKNKGRKRGLKRQKL
ncbi:MAG: hypothetical protein V4594_19965 [Bacteroidota bacterium]